MEDPTTALDRRRLLALAGAGLAAGLAGCSGGDGPTTTEPTTTEETATDTATPEPATTTAATTTGERTPAALEPASVPADARCPVCNMVPADFPDWNAQALHDDGERAFFDTSGCAVTYYALPDEFAATDAALAGLWVTDFETRETVDGTTAHYALETDSDRVADPMRVNPAPFADRADAEAYVDAVDYLTTEDVVGLDAFDRELASQYRAGFIEE
jgi:nitrous oxide reductase accessory protein NosL